ncbi:MAG: DegT/DnrJ/EryC1/StrS family aminotransferase [Candidatus Omnitrophica bacterium]|nr:DegT/DnrJ/EryC1/StrS family aminotransferase [Candidatus Omnitrophota bacterium]
MKSIPRFMPSLTKKDLIQSLFCMRKASLNYWVGEFSKQFADYIGVSFAIPAPLARVAFAAALVGFDFPEGKEVILPSLTFHGIPEIVKGFRLQPRFIDIDPGTYCMDVSQLEKNINSSTVAIIPVHLYGRACNMKQIMEVARSHNLKVIEDCAQSCGAVYSGKRLGNFGDAAIFSFDPHKNISALGGGMLVTNSKELASRAASWLDKIPPMSKWIIIKQWLYSTAMYFVTQPWFWPNILDPILKLGSFCGLDLIESLTDESPSLTLKSKDPKDWQVSWALQGKLALSQLKRLDSLNKRRIKNGDQLLKELKKIPDIKLSLPVPYGENIYSTFVIQVKSRQDFRRRMRKLGIDTHGGNMFVGPLLPGFEKRGEYKAASEVTKDMVHLPVYPQLGELEIRKIVKAVKTVFS